jgi:hypothetical protein
MMLSLDAVRTPRNPVRTEPVLRQAQDDRNCKFKRVDYSAVCAEGFLRQAQDGRKYKLSPNGGR